MIQILIADKHSLVRAGIRATLINEKDLTLVGEVSSSCEARQLSQKLKPNVLILSSNLTDSTLTETLIYLHDLCPEVKVLVLTVFTELYSHNLVVTNVAGCVLKDEEPETLVSATRTVAQGHTWFSQTILEKLLQQEIRNSLYTHESNLTNREQEILSMIAQAWGNARIAAEIGLAEQTVRNYISRIYNKLGVGSRTEAVVWAREHTAVFNWVVLNK